MRTLFAILQESRATGDSEKWLCERVQKLESQRAADKERLAELNECVDTLLKRVTVLSDAAQAMSFHSMSFEQAKAILYKGIETHPSE